MRFRAEGLWLPQPPQMGPILAVVRRKGRNVRGLGSPKISGTPRIPAISLIVQVQEGTPVLRNTLISAQPPRNAYVMTGFNFSHPMTTRGS